MGPAAQDHFDQAGSIGSDGSGFALDALVGPAGVAAMGARHVLGHGGVAAAGAAQQMTGDPLALVEQLDGALGDARLDLLAQQAVWHRVVMAIDVDVIVEPDAALAPFGIDIGLDRQGRKGGRVELLEELAAAHAQPPGPRQTRPHRPAIQFAEQHGDRAVQLGQREEALVAQAGQDPALDHLDCDLDLGLVARPSRAGRQDRRAVVGGEVLVGWIEAWFVPVGLEHAGLEVVGHDLARHPAEEGERPPVRTDPIGQRLRPARLGVGVARRTQHGDEDLRDAHLAGAAIDQLDGLAGIVDEQPLAGRMHLPHGGRQPALPFLVELAEARVAVPLRRCRPVLLPQQHQRDAWPA